MSATTNPRRRHAAARPALSLIACALALAIASPPAPAQTSAPSAGTIAATPPRDAARTEPASSPDVAPDRAPSPPAEPPIADKPVADTASEAPTITPAIEAAATPPAPGEHLGPRLPHELSPLGMFLAADVVVKAVMIALLIASVLTWTVWLAKNAELLMAARGIRPGLARLRTARSLAELRHDDKSQGGFVQSLVAAASHEMAMSAGLPAGNGVRERIASRFDEIELEWVRRLRAGVGLLANIGATAPFVGLFGTVWGIMNSFIGISKAQTTNLAVVAPGIAEALLATAIGLVAAIPAVLFYNQLSRALARHRALARSAVAETQRLASRDLDRLASDPRLGLRLAGE